MNLLEKFQNWIKSDKVKELEQRLAKIERTEVSNEGANKVELTEKLISKTLYDVNSQTIIVVLTDGSLLNGQNISQEQYLEIQNCNDRQCILTLLSPPKEEVVSSHGEEEEQIKEQISSLVGVLKEVEDFDVVDNKVFLKGIKSIELPSSIVAEFIRILSTTIIQENIVLNEEYNALLMFSYKLLLNPLQESREQLLTFVKHNNIKITALGNLVLYRACYESDENNELVKFVAKEYLKIKNWKKSPKNYWVYTDTLGRFYSENNYIESFLQGNLAELYQQLPKLQKEGKQYYSSHGSKKIVIGDVYKIDENEVDLRADVCHSGGLHCASVNYNYSCYGNVNLVVLVNPSKTITVPTYDIAKMRVSEMFILGINEKPIGEHVSDELVHTFDEEYHNYNLEQLKTSLTEKSLANVSISDAVSDLSLKEVGNVTEILNKRVVTI